MGARPTSDNEDLKRLRGSRPIRLAVIPHIKMAILTFIVEILKALSSVWWPLAVVICVALLRSDLGGLIARITSYKDKEREITFGAQIEDTRAKFELIVPQQALPAPSPTSNSSELHIEEIHRIQKFAEDSPRAGIVEAWLHLEAAVYSAASARGVDTSGRPFSDIVGSLGQLGALDSGAQQVALELRDLRNSAVHDSDFNIPGSKASTYVSICLALAKIMRDETAKIANKVVRYNK